MRVVSERKFYIVKMSKLRNTSVWTCDGWRFVDIQYKYIGCWKYSFRLFNYAYVRYSSSSFHADGKTKKMTLVFVMINRAAARHAIALQRKCTAIHIENCATAKICINIQPVPVDGIILLFGIVHGFHVRLHQFAADFHWHESTDSCRDLWWNLQSVFYWHSVMNSTSGRCIKDHMKFYDCARVHGKEPVKIISHFLSANEKYIQQRIVNSSNHL